MKESYLVESLEKFHELPDPIQEMIGGVEACVKIKELEDIYNISLSFATILIAIGELTIDDLPDYLNLKFNIPKATGEEIAEKLEEAIFIDVLDLILKSTEREDGAEPIETSDQAGQLGPITSLSPENKKELILKTFNDSIVPALQAEPVKLQDFNIAIFQIFDTDETLADKLENLLYNNQEKLSDHHITMDGHPASPTIANWLKDFIKKYGSDLFDEVALAEYLSQSPNVKQLKPTEKDLIRKVLKLYRNLSFFPDSMEGVPVEQWEIFPVDRNLLPKIANLPKVVEPKEEIDPAIVEKQKVIFDLQKSLVKYSSTSLEYKAISQEINRLSKK